MEKEAPCTGSLTMTVTLELEPEVESRLEKRARAEGCDVKGYMEKLIEKEVNRERTFDEILAPFRDAVERSGISDEELDALLAEARRDASKIRREGEQTMLECRER
jgi:predicted transcriptional regulator